MYKPFLLLIIFSITLTADAQIDIKNYVKENAVLVSTIQPDSLDFSDLEAFGNAIGQSKIVMLGEQDHGDAPTFLAKTRLIRYLHEKKGFNVLAFESDFFALNYGWSSLEKTENKIDSFLKKNIYGIWTTCDACQKLFYEIIPGTYKTKTPLVITGFDSQTYLKYSSNNLTQKFDSVLKALDLPVTRTENYSSYILPLIDTLTKQPVFSKDSSFFNSILKQLYIIQSELALKIEPGDFWSLVMNSLIQRAIEFKYIFIDFSKGNNARDMQMSNNLSWLNSVKFPNDKIIVWAHNYHISKFGGNYAENSSNAKNSMGTEFTKDPLQNTNTYILGFTSYTGTAGRIPGKPYVVEKPAKNGFENWIDSSYNYAFIDFRKFNSLNPNAEVNFNMKGSIIKPHKNHSAQWARIFDGVFYIRNMYPCSIAN
ncbi:MAG: erythromycin esterase family protein [Ferruginibacter sp.]